MITHKLSENNFKEKWRKTEKEKRNFASNTRAVWVEGSWKGTTGAVEKKVFLVRVNSGVSKEIGKLTVQSCGLEAHLFLLALVFVK